MKINEASVIDNKVIDELIEEYEKQMDNIFCTEEAELYHKLVVLKHIKSHSKPLEPIARDAYCMGRIDIRGLFTNKYINETEI